MNLHCHPEHDRLSCSDTAPINADPAGSTGCARCTAILLEQREQAIAHLQSILNTQRTATQSWQAEQEARQWLLFVEHETRP